MDVDINNSCQCYLLFCWWK